MLMKTRTGPHHPLAAKQRGVVLMMAMIVLVMMTLAGIALVRSLDTTNIIAGNMAFQQSATLSGDTGVETAIAWLAAANNNLTLNTDDAGNAYASNGNSGALNPAANQSWDDYWTQALANRARTLPSDASGNTVSYVIDRLCTSAGSPTGGANCSTSPILTAGAGNSEEGGELAMDAPSQVYYRITSRIGGPRSTVGYIQAVIAM